MELSAILEQIKQKKTDLEYEVDTSSPTYRMAMGNKVRAKEDIQGLEALYAEEIKKRLILILVTGKGADKFASMAEQDYDMIPVDASDLVNSVVNKIQVKEYVGKNFSPSAFETVSIAIRMTLGERGILSDSELVYDSNVHGVFIQDKHQFLSLVETSLLKDFSPQLFALDIIRESAKKGLQEGFDGEVFPVVAKVENEDLALLISKEIKSVVVSTEGKQGKGVFHLEKVNKGTVAEVMSLIKNNSKEVKISDANIKREQNENQ